MIQTMEMTPDPGLPVKRVGRYELIRRLGMGGMAEVFLARRSGIEEFEQICVVKTILPQFAHDPDFVEMFFDEARITVKLQHANVVRVFDLDRDGDLIYLAMEFIDGMDALSLMVECEEREVTVPFGLVLYVISETLKGLHFAHAATDMQGRPLGLIHRDISPGNILLGVNGAVKLSDFGVARATISKRSEEPGLLVGKLRYFAPELLVGGDASPSSDIFALGTCFYEMLSMEPLFPPADNLIQQQLYIQKWTPEQTLEKHLNFPDGADEILLKALAKDPADRYRSAQEFLEDITDLAFNSQIRLWDFTLTSFLPALRQAIASEEAREPTANRFRTESYQLDSGSPPPSQSTMAGPTPSLSGGVGGQKPPSQPTMAGPPPAQRPPSQPTMAGPPPAQRPPSQPTLAGPPPALQNAAQRPMSDPTVAQATPPTPMPQFQAPATPSPLPPAQAQPPQQPQAPLTPPTPPPQYQAPETPSPLPQAPPTPGATPATPGRKRPRKPRLADVLSKPPTGPSPRLSGSQPSLTFRETTVVELFTSKGLLGPFPTSTLEEASVEARLSGIELFSGDGSAWEPLMKCSTSKAAELDRRIIQFDLFRLGPMLLKLSNRAGAIEVMLWSEMNAIYLGIADQRLVQATLFPAPRVEGSPVVEGLTRAFRLNRGQALAISAPELRHDQSAPLLAALMAHVVQRAIPPQYFQRLASIARVSHLKLLGRPLAPAGLVQGIDEGLRQRLGQGPVAVAEMDERELRAAATFVALGVAGSASVH